MTITDLTDTWLAETRPKPRMVARDDPYYRLAVGQFVAFLRVQSSCRMI